MTGINDGSHGNQVGTSQAPIDPLLAPLGNYGGPTQTMALLPGSPAIGAGTSSRAPSTDQRGFSRGSTVDIGAFQSQGFTLTPVASSTGQTANVSAAFRNPLTVTVAANDVGQFIDPVDGGVISFAAPSTGASATLSSATAVISTIQGVPQASVSATADATAGPYSVTATAAGAGSASFALTNTQALGLTQKPGQVTTTTPSQTPTPENGSNMVVVTGGVNSLRETIAYANTHPGPETITFDPAVFLSKHRTIRIVGGPLVVTNPATTTIIGPGARLLTFKGNGRRRVFDIRGGSLALSGVSITGGRANHGGDIRNDGGTLWLTDVIIRNNFARRSGGGLFNSGTATLTDVVVRGNHARVGEDFVNIGTLSLTGVTIPGNSVRLGPGPSTSGAAALADLIMRNTARFGSGMFGARKATLTWRRSPAKSADEFRPVDDVRFSTSDVP
jgi:hypothetical protein